MSQRSIVHAAQSMPTSDGAGVHLRRALGTPRVEMVDPFLKLDEFFSDDPKDYLAGFPNHPHRGFETVTYMLEGTMEHEDSVGNHGILRSGDVQWMTAGRGIIHSEMPKQASGMLRGFQLWVNLPASHKMVAPRYQEIRAKKIPIVHGGDGGFVKVIAGEFEGAVGPVEGVFTQPLMLDIGLSQGGQRSIATPSEHAAFVYVFEGDASFGTEKPKLIKRGCLGVLGEGETLHISSESGARILLLAAKPLKEPVARHGPFVMNTVDELEQAFADYRAGRLV